MNIKNVFEIIAMRRS